MSYFVDKKVFITGASSGIGAELARQLHRQGAAVGLLARREERLRALAEELSPEGERVAWATADVTDGEELDQALDQLEQDLGGVDMLVANAGFGRPEAPHRFEPGQSLSTYDTNLFGMLRALDWVLPRFLEQRSGHIVGVASVASYWGLTNSASYCGSKAAMRIHLQGLRLSLWRYGIHVTTICPGFVESELTDGVRYNMPFYWDTPRAVRRICRALERQEGETIFPWQMRALVLLTTRFLPRRLVEAVARRYSPRPQDRDPRGEGLGSTTGEG